jgi:hypothetical protein
MIPHLCLFSAALGFEPDFLYPLENVTIAQGRDAMFTCVVNNLGGYRVSADLAPARVRALTLLSLSLSLTVTVTVTVTLSLSLALSVFLCVSFSVFIVREHLCTKTAHVHQVRCIPYSDYKLILVLSSLDGRNIARSCEVQVIVSSLSRVCQIHLFLIYLLSLFLSLFIIRTRLLQIFVVGYWFIMRILEQF